MGFDNGDFADRQHKVKTALNGKSPCALHRLLYNRPAVRIFA